MSFKVVQFGGEQGNFKKVNGEKSLLVSCKHSTPERVNKLEQKITTTEVT